MTDFLKFFLLGLGAGGIYALLALGVVLVYRGSGIVNFANGGLALLGASVFVETRKSMGTPVAVGLAIVASAAAGALIQVLIMRRMRKSSPLARVIATLGLLTIFQEGAIRRYGTQVKFVQPFLPTSSLQPMKHVIIGSDRLVILAITVALSAILWAIYHYTRFGLATTGVAENERVAASLGWSPNFIATVNWAAGGALAAIAGVLLVPIVGLSASSLTLTIVPALSAALVGAFASFPLTLLGGLLIGVLESEATRYVHAPGWATAVPFLVIIFILVVRGRALPLRSHLADRLPRIGTGRIKLSGILVTALLVGGSFTLFTKTWQDAVTTSVLYGFICLSLVVVTGYCGQLSLAQYALAGVGALISSRLADAGHVPFLAALVLGVLLTIPIGLLVALPAVRARGVNLAVATLGLAVVISSVLLSNPAYTGGVIRGTIVPKASLFGWSIFSIDHTERYALFAMLLLALSGVLVANMRRGRTGRRLIAVRNNERAAASLGISVVGAKLYAFSLGSAIAALGGVLIAFRFQNVSFQQFDVFGSIQAVLVTVIGGVGYILGALIGGTNTVGGVGQQLLSHFFNVTGWFALIAAVLLIIIVVREPNGIGDQMTRHGQHLVDAVRSRLGRANLEARGATAALLPNSVRELAAEGRHHRVEPRTLELRNVTLRFGGVTALDDVSLTVEPGEVVGLIGPNGAGKTTLIDIATGFHRHYTGSVLVDGEPIDGLRPSGRARAAITRSFQSLELFDDLTVEDNLRAASDPRDIAAYFTDLLKPGRPPLSSPAVASIVEFQLGDLLLEYPEALPYAKRRLVAIARAVAAAPSILLLDEPAAGLDETSTRELADLIRRLARDWGMAVLLIEHDVSMVLGTCDRVVALNFGQVLATGTPDEIRRNQAVIAAYLGSSADAPVVAPTKPGSPEVLAT